jgi:hypothetical protein
MHNDIYYKNTEHLFGIGKNSKKAHNNNVWSKIKNASLKAKFATLMPFKPLMVKILDKKGIKHTNDIQDIALKFYELITGKKLERTYRFDGDAVTEHFAVTATMVTTIVVTIINFFKSANDRARAEAEAGKELTPAQQTALEAEERAKEIANQVNEKEPEQKKPEKKDNMLTYAGLALMAYKLLGNG